MHASPLVASPSLEHLRQLSRRAWWLHALLISQLALLPCPLSQGVWVEIDTDGDGVMDTGYEDGTPETATHMEPLELEGTADADGDGLMDAEETAVGADPCNPDSDYDGLTDADEVRLTGTNPLSADSDGDGISDYNAFYGNPAVDTLWHGDGATPYDWDGDGLHDPVDPDPFSSDNIADADGDYVPDPEDSHPLNPSLWNDANGNGINDDAEAEDADFDGDGVSDATDSHPADPGLDNDWNDNGIDDEHEDWDEDGVSNLQDSHPNSNILWCDWNGNGVNDDAEAAVAAGHELSGNGGEEEPTGVMPDTDGDGYADDRDSHPADPGLWTDHNGDGINDDTEAPIDTDRDGIPDARDAAPEDHDNDGLSDAEEWAMGTHPGEMDSDGDGLGDGEEVHGGTNPLSVDSDGDGLTDSEELFAYHSDPLEPTSLTLEAESTPTVETLSAGSSYLSLSHRIPDPGSDTGSRQVEHAEGGSLAFPSRSALRDKSDLTKTLVLTQLGDSAVTALSAHLFGPDAVHFKLGNLSALDLEPGAESHLTVTFLAPSPATTPRTATLTLHGGNPPAPLFVLHLRSIASSGLWALHDEYFFADYTDSDEDGIPDLVEDMYAPLVVTAEGDLDGDGVSNLEQYLSGRDLRDRARSNDVDGDGLTNAVEDAWNAAYPGRLNKYHFADAFEDPDKDGLLTVEELTCTWGGQKDPHAVATHPFVTSSAPPAAGKTTTYKTASRKPPKGAPREAAAQEASGPILSRCSRYAAWMNDGLLRRACRETAATHGDRLPADFFTPEWMVDAATTTLQTTQGSDHLPRGYLAWLGRQTPAIAVPSSPTHLPDDTAQPLLRALHLPVAADPDADTLPTAWEAAYELNWREAADSRLDLAISSLTTRHARLTSLHEASDNPVLEAERMAIAQVRDRLLAAGSGWSATVFATPEGSQSTRLVPVFAITEVKYPPALSVTAASDESRRASWIAQQADALHWHVLAGLDPDHDGLMNADEYLLGLSPRLPDFGATGERDSDGDGFIDAIELATGTDHLNRAKKPSYAIEILTPTAGRVATALQPLTQPLQLQTVLRGPGGSWPVGGQRLSAHAPDNQTLLAWEHPGAPLEWQPKTVAATETDDHGKMVLHVHPGWKKGSLRLTFKSSPSASLPAGLRTALASCPLTVSALPGDTDADSLPDAWETRPAADGLPAHGLNKNSPLDAAPGPQHFGYHPATPAAHLPDEVNALLADLQALEDDLGYLPEYPVTKAGPAVLAPPTTDAAATTVRDNLLARIDPDHDGWSNRVELENGTHPQVPDNPGTATRDTDGDGVADVLELQEGTNPQDAGSVPVMNLTDATLAVVWGDGQSAPPGALAPQPVVVQLLRTNGVLLKRVMLEASCPGGYFSLPSSGGRNVQWQADRLPLMTDTKGKASFHVWTPADQAPQWTIRVRSTANVGIEAQAVVTSLGSSGSGSGAGSGPGANDRKPNLGDNPGFNNSHAPFVIRFVEWKSGAVSSEASVPGAGSGAGSYKASKQAMRWERGGDGAPRKVPNGSTNEESIGTHTLASAQAWMEEWNRSAPLPYSVKRHAPQWIEGAEDNGVYAETYRLDNGAEQFESRTLVQSFGSEEEYHYYMNSPRADDYDVPDGGWDEVLAVYPVEDPGGGTNPEDPSKNTTRHRYQQQVPQTFSTVAEGLDTSRRETSDPVGMLNNLGTTIRMEDKRLPNGQREQADGQMDWDGILASASMQLTKTQSAESGDSPTYSGQRSQGKVVIAWDPNYPVSLNEKSREAWLQRFVLIRNDRQQSTGADPIVTTTAFSLADHLSTTATESEAIPLNPGAAEEGMDKTVTLSLLPMDLAIDANRDGAIAQGETASKEQPLRFWINNDHDSESTTGEAVDGAADHADNILANLRDLEDFQLLRFSLPKPILQAANEGRAHIGLKWKNVSGSMPSIRLFRAHPSIASPNDYVWDKDKAELQVLGSRYTQGIAVIDNTSGTPLPRNYISYSLHGFGYTEPPFILFEGIGKGRGQLCLVFRFEGSSTVECPGPWLDLCDIKEMYVRNNVSEFIPPARGTELEESITFVHGWNMSPEGAAVFAETLFKRLWHKGFKGRFAAFRWNTDWSDAFDKVPGIGEPLEAYLADYNGSEFTAWKSGLALKNFVNLRPASYRSMLVAHSMGNIVAGSALSQGLSVDKYVLLQAAVPSSCYDDRVELKETETRKNINWLPDPTLWDEWTPDDDYDPEAYRGKLLGIGGEPTSFYQPDDVATSYAWEINNDLTKEAGKLAKNVRYYERHEAGKRCVQFIHGRYPGGYMVKVLTGPEALTKVCRSWSKAVGAQGKTRGAIKSFINNDDFGFEDEHSAEFNFPIQSCESFYERLATELNLSSS